MNPPLTDSKTCSETEGSVLVQANLHRVRIGNHTAIIHAYSSGLLEASEAVMRYQIYLEFGSDSNGLQDAQSEATEIVSRLFPEFVT